MENFKSLFLYLVLFVTLLWSPSAAHEKSEIPTSVPSPVNAPAPINPPSKTPNAPSNPPPKTSSDPSNPPSNTPNAPAPTNPPSKTPSVPSNPPSKTPNAPAPTNPPPNTPYAPSNPPSNPSPNTPNTPSNPPLHTPNAPAPTNPPPKTSLPNTPYTPSNPPPKTPNAPAPTNPQSKAPNAPSNPPPKMPPSNSPPKTQNAPSNPSPNTPNTPSNPPPKIPKTPSDPPPNTANASSNPPPNMPNTASNPPPKIPKTPSDPPPAENKTPNAPSGGTVQTNSTTSAQIEFSGSFKKVFAFGDSFTDTGNAFMSGGLQSFVTSVLSQTFFGPSQELPGQRFCNGKLVIDFLCDKLSIPTISPYKNASLNVSSGVNFAISGSTALSTDFFANLKIGHDLMWQSVPESFQTQIDWFNQFMMNAECKGKSADECKSQLEGILFWFGEMGGNDYARIFGSSVPGHWVAEQCVAHVSKMLKTVMDRGAKYIVVQGLPPLGCCPLQLLLAPLTGSSRDPRGCSASANAMISAHNDLLQKELEALRKQYSNCTIVYADYWGAVNSVLENPKKFNFEEPFKCCCGTGGGPLNFKLNSLCGALGTSTCKSPDQYINWDGIHFTEAMNGVLADLFINKGFCKPSFEEIIKMKKSHLKSLGLI